MPADNMEKVRNTFAIVIAIITIGSAIFIAGLNWSSVTYSEKLIAENKICVLRNTSDIYDLKAMAREQSQINKNISDNISEIKKYIEEMRH